MVKLVSGWLGLWVGSYVVGWKVGCLTGRWVRLGV